MATHTKQALQPKVWVTAQYVADCLALHTIIGEHVKMLRHRANMLTRLTNTKASADTHAAIAKAEGIKKRMWYRVRAAQGKFETQQLLKKRRKEKREARKRQLERSRADVARE